MPIITKLVQQKRHPDRYSVYLDGVFSFGLSSLDVSTSGLRSGMLVSNEQVNNWQRFSEEGNWYNRAVNLISYRRRSQKEVVDYLKTKDVDDEVIKHVVERLTDLNLINDRDFADAWIADRQLLRPRSTKMLVVELMKKGISRDIIKDAISGIDHDFVVEQLMKIIESKRKQTKYADDQKLMGYLARQGYEYEVIKKALKRLDDN